MNSNWRQASHHDRNGLEQPSPSPSLSDSEMTPAALRAAVGVWIGFLVGANVVVASTNGLFMPYLGEALGVGRGAISAALASSVWIVGLLAPFSGWAMDRFGARRLLLLGATLCGLTILALSQVTAFWQFVAVQAILALAFSLHGSVGYSKVAAMWFDRRRGMVLGLCVAFGSGLGQIIMPKLVLFFIEQFGWRGGYVGISAIVLLLGLPLLFYFVRVPTRPARSNAASQERAGLTRAEALRRPAFYLLFAAIFFAAFSLIGTIQHAVPMLIERGLARGDATTVLSCVFLGVVIGEVSSGYVIDRINSPRIVLPYFLIALVGLLIVCTSADFHILLAGGVMMGLGLGCETGQNAYLTSRFFGLKHFGQLFGLTFLAVCLGIGLGMISLGFIHDHYGNYGPARFLMGTTMTLSVLCIALLPPFSFKPEPR